MSMNERGAIQSLCGRFLGCQMRFWRFLSIFGDALSRIFKLFKNEYSNRKYLLMTREMSPRNRVSHKKLEKVTLVFTAPLPSLARSAG